METFQIKKERLRGLIFLIEIDPQSSGDIIHEKANVLSIAKSYLRIYTDDDKLSYAIERCEKFLFDRGMYYYKKVSGGR